MVGDAVHKKVFLFFSNDKRSKIKLTLKGTILHLFSH
jgi:hypothetical protein